MSLVRGKFSQHAERLYQQFRHIDLNKNSLIERDEFVRVVSVLGTSLDEVLVGRVFDLLDSEGQGTINYDTFARKFCPAVDVLSEKKVRCRGCVIADS